MRWSEEDYFSYMKQRQAEQRRQQEAKKPKKKSKYRSKKTWTDGICFDSQKEAAYYTKLKALHSAGAIDGFMVHGAMVCTEGTDKENRATLYEPDFVILFPDGTYKIIDTKSDATITQVFKLKMKALREKYPKITVHIEN